MTDATKLFRSGRRYRGFLQTEEGFAPVTFTIYPLNAKEIKLKYVFPTTLIDRFREGNILYVLIEEGEKLIGELRITQRDPEKRSIVASLDFVTKDRRKLPRVKVGGILDITAKVYCEEGEFTGKVSDVSMASMSVNLDTEVKPQECEVEIVYRGLKTKVRGKIVRSSKGTLILEFIEGNSEITNLLSKVYSDIFIKAQRNGG
ncbi:PilZ domain-containing protein [Hydrogenivirga sp.]